MLTSNGKIYFASDFHLGVPDIESSRNRERLIIKWLEEISHDAKAIYLLGDIFDFWFEYKRVITKGFVRLQGKLAELTDKGISIHFFTGNHDMWTFGYLAEEIGMKVHKTPVIHELSGKKFFIGHGDGLGPNDKGYKVMKWIFSASFFQWLFARFHPNFSVRIAESMSRRSRIANSYRKDVFLGEDKEHLVLFIKEYLKKEHVDYFIFGHRHITLDLQINNSRYINIGEWVNKRSYAIFDGKDLEVRTFDIE